MILKNFFVFEGIDGSGTSTQINLLANQFSQKIFTTAEPTTNQTGIFLRKMLAGKFSVDEKTSAYLFAADRCEHIYGKNGIIENLNNNKIVISDRYFFSSLAYQSLDSDGKITRLLNSPFPLPEILFFFKIAPEISLKRVDSRNEKKEIFEKLDLQQKIAQQYEKIILEYENQNEMKIITIDATKSIEEINKIILNELKTAL